MRHAQIYLFFFICLAVLSCNQTKSRPDISKIKVNTSIERFDKELNQLKPDSLQEPTKRLRKKYGRFYDDYIERILTVGSARDTNYYENLSVILQNPDYLELSTTVNQTFPDLKKQESELNLAFRHIRYYYPKQKFPRIISFISGFAVQTPLGNDYIGIGLDMFLGNNGDRFYPAIRQSIPQYISRRFRPEYITPRIVETLAREEMFPENDDSPTLLSKMIYNGKILYFMDAVLPETSDTLKVGYTKEQLQWCRDYQGDIWAYFLQNELLYEADYMKIQKYLTEAPFTPGLGENSDSAPKLGVWTGWQIVKAYMERKPEITLQQLMLEMDSQKILAESKYKPR